MRNLGVTLIALSVLIVVGITGYLLLAAGSTQPAPTSDQEFIDSVQDRAPAGGGGGTEQGNLPPADSGQGLPVIRVETDHFDMGTVKNDGYTFKEMKVFNDGDAPLLISKVTTTCNCTIGKMKSNEIPPKGEGTLVIRLNPNIVPGFQSLKTLTLTSNDPTNSQQKVKVSALVDAEIGFEVEQVDFKQLAQGKGAEQSLKIRQLQNEPFQIAEATPTALPGIFSASVASVPPEEWLAPGKQEYLMTVRVSPDAPVGIHTERFRLRFTGMKRLRSMLFFATAEVQGAYALSAQSLSLKTRLGGTLKDVLKLTSSNTIDLVSVTSKNELITVSHRTGEEPNSFAFDLQVAAEGTEKRMQTDEWELKLNIDGDVVTQTIPVLVLLDFDEASAEKTAS